ncbi:MAG: MoaD/ThiS family protein [Pyrinomonadaceae bacterium]|nr:MoaD/ThiS family protein [Phycisphaerales bacterium]
MIVRVQLFGPYAAAIGSDEVAIDAPEAVTSEQVLSLLGHQHSQLVPLLQSARLAVNHSFAVPGTVIGERDELAVIGMVSGG